MADVLAEELGKAVDRYGVGRARLDQDADTVVLPPVAEDVERRGVDEAFDAVKHGGLVKVVRPYAVDAEELGPGLGLQEGTVHGGGVDDGITAGGACLHRLEIRYVHVPNVLRAGRDVRVNGDDLVAAFRRLADRPPKPPRCARH